MKLVANMVGRNESTRFLTEVLEHLKTFTDHIVFTDDCSDDDTKQIAQDLGCYTYQTSEPLFSTNEGKLRQTAWSNLENHAVPGDWILAIDCDEKLYTGAWDLDSLMNQNNFDVINIRFYHMWNENKFRIDKAWVPNNSSRMFRFYPGGTYIDRRLACGSEPLYVQDLIRAGRFMIDSDLRMQHLGYIRDEDKQAKYERYMKLDGGDFHAKAHIESIIDTQPTLEAWSA